MHSVFHDNLMKSGGLDDAICAAIRWLQRATRSAVNPIINGIAMSSTPAFLPHPSCADAADVSRVCELIQARTLVPHFQPIVDLNDGKIHGHEALIRTPAGCRWPNPDALFAAAREQGQTAALEIECIRVALSHWHRHASPGRLFLNISATTLVEVLAQMDIERVVSLTTRGRLAGSSIVIELTEHEHVKDFDALLEGMRRLRGHGMAVALDDFGDGRSSLRLWSELKPEVVKIDKYFTRGLHSHPEKVQTLRALMQISQTLGASLVAEGVETAEDLRLLRDLGIPLGQGWYLGRPAPQPAGSTLPSAQAVIASTQLAVIPERRRQAQQRAAPWTLLDDVPPVQPDTTNDQVFARFNADERLFALAVVDAQGRPVGLVSRQQFVARYAKPFFPEVFGRSPCLLFANQSPRMVDLHADIDALTEVLTSEDQRYLTEGFVIVEEGSYRGLGSGEKLVRRVTEARIEAARHANPLTLLPGNIPLTQHIERLLASGCEFVACYGDLNHFKPFNDIYGYWRGDEMILLASRCFTAHAEPTRDFLGHVGGDDFVLLLQSSDWQTRCQSVVRDFNAQARALYDDEARQAGGVVAEDRHGTVRFHALVTLSIGVCRVPAHSGATAEEVASCAAGAKHKAKKAQTDLYTVELGQH
jgi:diguanylate cyclase (GGDEF)-like protein